MHRLAVLLWKPFLSLVLVMAVLACGGSSCSGCEACGIGPIPGAFPLNNPDGTPARIMNAAQIRLTDTGIAFVEDNIDAIVANFLAGGLDFAIPMTATSTSGFDVDVCPSGDCSAHIEIDSLDLTPTTPNRLHAEVHAIVDTRDAAGARRGIPVHLEGLCAFGICAVNTTCMADIDTRRTDPPYVGLITDIDFNVETEPARAGYTRIDIVDPHLDPTLSEDMVDFGGCTGISGAIINAVSGLLIGTLVGQLEDQVTGLLDSAIGDQLCATRGTAGCPTNTCSDGTAEDASCHFAAPGADGACTGSGADAECVPMLLGMDGRGDLGEAVIGGFSPGTHAPIQFVLAAGGDPAVPTSGAETVNNGMSLFMIGGMQSWDRAFATSPGHNACVPMLPRPPLPTVARSEVFRGNSIPGLATSPHMGIGISEDYLDYAGYGLFDAGALCIGAGTRLSQQLSTGLVSALIRPLNNIAFPVEDAPLAIALRPQAPPDFAIGTASGAPLLTVTLPDLQMDFYVWSTERYVRFMTYESDLVVEIGLTVEGGQLVPSIEGITPMNSSVTNSELLGDEDPAALADVLETVLNMFASMLGSSISPFDLPEIMGFNLIVPAGGIRGVADSGENFLGIFANLELAAGSPITSSVETSIRLDDLTLDPASMTVGTWGDGDGNSVWAYLEADGPIGVDYEYSYRIDGMSWHPWTRDRRIFVDDDALLFQARHVIEARARVVGEPMSVDATPAAAELLVDILAPRVDLSGTGDGFVAVARDVITAESDLEYRWQAGDEGAAWTDWTPARDLVLTEEQWHDLRGNVTVEVRDQAGNVSRASLPIIRGIPNPAGGGGCGCRVTSPASSNGPLASIAALLVLGLFVARRARSRSSVARRVGRGVAHRAGTFRSARRAVAALFFTALTFGAVGCDCAGGPTGEPCDDSCTPAAPPGRTRGSVCCESTDMCVMYDVNELCEPGFTCPVAEVELDTGCEVSCGMCRERPPLEPGVMALDLDYVDTADGRFVSGYSPGVPPDVSYGDLVFGEVTATGVDWEIVDGAPSTPITNSLRGWRGGVSAPGDDVGRWTALADSGTNLYIAYYDVTNGDLKIAVGAPGAWDIHSIDETGDSGRYASIVLVGGVPVVSYLRVDTAAADGTVRSSVRVARASSATPDATTDWTTSEVAGATTPCRAAWCGTGRACLETGLCAMTGSGCSPACGSDEECVAGACTAVLGSGYVEDIPPVYGAYTRLAVAGGGLALVWYDRSTGSLYGAASADGTTWGTAFLIDGYTGPGVGDTGIGASLFVDMGGLWHVTYVNGTDEELRYAQVNAGTVTVRERIDDGATNGTTPHDDGRHVVGDDSSVVVTAGGEVRVAYQDATDAVTMLARRSAPGTWTIEVLDDTDASGFWVEQEVTTAGSSVASWWRQPDDTNGVRITEVP